jgi:hypothetical protein
MHPIIARSVIRCWEREAGAPRPLGLARLAPLAALSPPEGGGRGKRGRPSRSGLC